MTKEEWKLINGASDSVVSVSDKKKNPRPKVNEEWRRKWERWNEDQHRKMGELLNATQRTDNP